MWAEGVSVLVVLLVGVLVLLELWPLQKAGAGERASLKAQLTQVRAELKGIQPQMDYARYIRTEREGAKLAAQLESSRQTEVRSLVLWRERWAWIAPLVTALLLRTCGVVYPRVALLDSWLWPLTASSESLGLQLIFTWALFRTWRKVGGACGGFLQR